MTYAVDDNDPAAEDGALGWSSWYRHRRELAAANAFELLVLAEIARATGNPLSAVDLTERAAWEFDQLGMHGPVILDEILRMSKDARAEARRRRQADRAVVADVDAWLAQLLPPRGAR